MSYGLIISPTAKKAFSRLLTKYPYPGLLSGVADALERLRHEPHKIKQPSFYGRPFLVVSFKENELSINLRIIYRFTIDEKNIEILDIAPLNF